MGSLYSAVALGVYSVTVYVSAEGSSSRVGALGGFCCASVSGSLVSPASTRLRLVLVACVRATSVVSAVGRGVGWWGYVFLGSVTVGLSTRSLDLPRVRDSGP